MHLLVREDDNTIQVDVYDNNTWTEYLASGVHWVQCRITIPGKCDAIKQSYRYGISCEQVANDVMKEAMDEFRKIIGGQIK